VVKPALIGLVWIGPQNTVFLAAAGACLG